MTETLGTVIRFHNAHTSIDVTVDQDKSAIRSLIAQLPLENLDFADNEGIEKLTRLNGPQFGDNPIIAINIAWRITPQNSFAEVGLRYRDHDATAESLRKPSRAYGPSNASGTTATPSRRRKA